MPTHDYSIANATGAAFRADLNNALAAIASTNSSSVEPPVPYAGMLWTDLSGGGDGVVRRRNGANNAWLTDVGIDSVARAAAAAAQNTANAALPKAGGTMTGPIVLPAADPVALQATSRTFTDATYQLKLLAPVAGSLLIGAAGGWLTKLDPGPANSVVAVVGGLPTYQLTATAAAADSIVRTKADGTIDASFIPAVASGLKYRGTFKPVVNDEYPTTGDNGSGAGGAPMVGDFWVIDGLTTGGYTYLQGTLAGITVYNGDSIAYDGAAWYRMGSSVSLQGYMKIDGSTSMAGDLNLGTHNIVNVANITARTGTPPTISGFSLDATNIILSPQRGTTGPDLAAMPTGQLGTDLGRMQIFVGAGASNVALVPVTFFSATAAYPTSSYVYNAADGYAYRSASAIAAGAFTASQWRRVVDTAGATFVGKVIIDGDISQGGLSIRNNGGANVLDIGVGVAGPTDPDVFIANRSATGAVRIYAKGAQPAGYFAPEEFMAPNQVRAAGGNFIGHPSSVVLAPNGAGTIYLRPNGPASATAEWTISSATGQLTGAYQVNAAAFVGSTVNTVLANVAGAGSGAIYFRPRGPGVSAAQVVIDYGGSVTSSADIYAGSGNYYVTTAFMVLGILAAGGGLVYIRPNPGTTNQSYFNPQGDLAVARNVIAANVPGSDPRMKTNIQPHAPRNLDALPMSTFYYNGEEKISVGTLSPDVRALAPEYVYTFSMLDESGNMVDREGVNYANLAFEVAMNLSARVAALEAAANPPPEPETV